VARVNLRLPELARDFKTRMRRHCQGRLAAYMIPVKVEFTEEQLHNARCKRLRSE
jgi:long-chain acyl-CoA synthetase